MLSDVLLSDERALVLAMGLLFCLAWLGAGCAVALLSGALERRARPGALRLRYWPGWVAAARFLGLSTSAGYLFLLLRSGLFVASDVGMGHIDPRAAWADLQRLEGWVSLTLPLLALLALLWGALWRASSADLAHERPPSSWVGALAAVLGYELALAILRGSLMPLAGVYWGVWLATGVKIATMMLLPQVRHNLRQPEGRAAIYLQWALDWQSAALFILYGDLTLTFATRFLSSMCLYALYRRLTRPRRVVQSVPYRP